jgi:predicted nuclease with TOPRIM domain
MAIFKVEGVRQSNDEPCTVYLEADDEAEARNLAIRHGVRSQFVAQIGRQHVPVGYEVLGVEKPAMREVLKEELVRPGFFDRHPIVSIAVGVALGGFGAFMLIVLFVKVFGEITLSSRY